MRVATFNIWGLPPPLSWPPRRRRYPRVRGFLAQGAFDVVGLQELWRPHPRSFPVSAWSAHLVVPGDDDANSGLALALRGPALEVVHRPYDAGARFFEAVWTRKGFLHARLPDVDVFTTHLQAYDTMKDAAVRARQVDLLLEAVDAVSRPTVVMGDFNLHGQNREDRATVKRIEGAGLVDAVLPFDPSPTWSVLGRSQRYDRIYVKGLEPVSAHVDRTRLSDHHPVVAELRPAT